MIDRIKQLMDKKKLSATQFSDEIGIQRSSLSHVLSGRNNPSLDFVLKVKDRFPEINFEWLLLGKGKMEGDDLSVIKKKSETKITASEDEKQSEMVFDSASEPVIANIGKRVSSEETDKPGYQIKKRLESKIPEKVILVYSDNTFEILSAKN